jgi:hypothetical protein
LKPIIAEVPKARSNNETVKTLIEPVPYVRTNSPPIPTVLKRMQKDGVDIQSSFHPNDPPPIQYKDIEPPKEHDKIIHKSLVVSNSSHAIQNDNEDSTILSQLVDIQKVFFQF